MQTKYSFCVISLICIFTAIYSTGYHHPDEHYQLIEFAGLKGGWNTGANLTWEYDAQIRPALQPMIALSVFQLSGLFGVESLFLLAMGLRFLTALLSCCCIGVFIRSFLPSIKKSYHTAFILLSFLLWFLPAINVRFSSETWAGLSLLLAVALIHSEKKRTPLAYIGIGVLLGLSFVFRFQMAIALAGLFLWLVFIKRENITTLSYLFSGGLLVVAGGFLLDSWFYGNWVFTPYNYYKANIVEGIASNFGTAPWYFYPEQLINRPTPLIGFLLLVAILLFCFFEYKNPVVWILLPFLLVHSLIPHKELRFLFPVVNYFPLVLILAWQKIISLWNVQTLKAVLYPVLGIALIVNTGGLVMLSFKPAGYGNIGMLQYIHNHYDRVNLYTIAWSNPYILGNMKGLTPRFYANEKVTIKSLSEALDARSLEKSGNNDLVMLLASYHERRYLEEAGFTVEKRSIPAWVEWMDRFYRVCPEYDYTFVLYSKPHEKEN
ncbi:hypothetical protein AGMMS50239_12400 [Bacteroidia bacterium]|nr:hypothetical protein AGMMS50239_12400 [Bacteroidia bacterium]